MFKIIENPDKNQVLEIKEALKLNNGYCPCSVIKSKDSKCMCQDFKNKLKNESFSGYCHCGLYYASR